uniref:Uncharacterized protein n=1 Tax=Vitis vinifera TaxID=29760 RepID=F6H5S8_VITVI
MAKLNVNNDGSILEVSRQV